MREDPIPASESAADDADVDAPVTDVATPDSPDTGRAAAAASRSERAARLLVALDPAPWPEPVPRPEYPRPQFVRERWVNLNGAWDFEIDQGDSGLDRGLLQRELADSITVPFAPESELSGIGRTDYLEAVWYRRLVTVPESWEGCTPVLHFGAVDHDATVWVDGEEVARHRGGFTSFSVDLAGHAAPGDTVLVTVRARDTHEGPQARGKQSMWYANSSCLYTRTTGIWQTVWLEGVPAKARIDSVRITPILATHSFAVEAPMTQAPDSSALALRVSISVPTAAVTDADSEEVIARAEVPCGLDMAAYALLTLPEEQTSLWDAGEANLYRVRLELVDADGAVVDRVLSYAGLRAVSIQGNRFLINGRPLFQRLVLDQGYWPQSLMTAPSDADLAGDIDASLAAGFNGARLHQKVFEERFHLHADVRGYLTWGEYGDWGVSGQGPIGHNQAPTSAMIAEWTEAVSRDRNHPSIIGWCPLNETHQVILDEITVLDDVTAAMFRATKAADPSRPVLDASGYSHRVRETDVYDAHNYEQSPRRFRYQLEGLAQGEPFANRLDSMHEGDIPHADGAFSYPYAGQPYFISEYGGIWWNEQAAAAAKRSEAARREREQDHETAGIGTDQEENLGTDQSESWGYGQRVADVDEFYRRFEGLTDVLLDDPNMFGYCYTQLTDVFQEQNGVYDFERRPKFDLDRLAAVQTRRAAYEGGEAKKRTFMDATIDRAWRRVRGL